MYAARPLGETEVAAWVAVQRSGASDSRGEIVNGSVVPVPKHSCEVAF